MVIVRAIMMGDRMEKTIMMTSTKLKMVGTFTYSDENKSDSWAYDYCVHCKKDTNNYFFETGSLGGGGGSPYRGEKGMLWEVGVDFGDFYFRNGWSNMEFV